jgi:hypothetical protein
MTAKASQSKRKRRVGSRRSLGGMIIAAFGFLTFLMGTSPELFGLDRSPVIGFVQIAVFLIGLAIICVGGYISLSSLWIGTERTIGADIGLRLVATGYVIAVASGMADVFGIGSQPWPAIPSFGRWQYRGVLIGEIVIAVGFLLLLPPIASRKKK